MAAVTVPPYNSYDDYYVTVSGRHYLRGQKQSSEDLYMKIVVVVRYLSSDKSIKRSKNFQGHHTFKFYKCPVLKLTSDDGKPPSSLSFDIISQMIDMMNIPFSLDRLHWIEDHNNGLYTTSTLPEYDDMVQHVLGYVRRCTNAGPPNFTPQPVGVEVTIEKWVILPHREFEAWIDWAGNRKEVEGVNFEKKYREVITGRPLRKLEYEFLKIRRHAEKLNMDTPAAKSSIGALEKMKFEPGGGSDHEFCSICMEKFLIGSQLTRMQCSHLYHEDCILSRLKENNRCPNCPFKLLSKLELCLLIDIES